MYLCHSQALSRSLIDTHSSSLSLSLYIYIYIYRTPASASTHSLLPPRTCTLRGIHRLDPLSTSGRRHVPRVPDHSDSLATQQQPHPVAAGRHFRWVNPPPGTRSRRHLGPRCVVYWGSRRVLGCPYLPTTVRKRNAPTKSSKVRSVCRRLLRVKIFLSFHSS